MGSFNSEIELLKEEVKNLRAIINILKRDNTALQDKIRELNRKGNKMNNESLEYYLNRETFSYLIPILRTFEKDENILDIIEDLNPNKIEEELREYMRDNYIDELNEYYDSFTE